MLDWETDANGLNFVHQAWEELSSLTIANPQGTPVLKRLINFCDDYPHGLLLIDIAEQKVALKNRSGINP